MCNSDRYKDKHGKRDKEEGSGTDKEEGSKDLKCRFVREGLLLKTPEVLSLKSMPPLPFFIIQFFLKIINPIFAVGKLPPALTLEQGIAAYTDNLLPKVCNGHTTLL